MPESLADVLIVGGGPVGLTVALVLARHGVRSVVLESRGEPTPLDESRALAWMPRGLELLDWLGLYGGFEARGLRRTSHEFWAGGRWRLALPFASLDSPHAHTLDLPQHDTEVLLEEAARETGLVDLRRGHRVAAVLAREPHASVRVEPASGSPYELSAGWAVGCDGFHSPVREALGIGTERHDYGAHSAVADFELECGLPPGVSRIVLDAERPHGLFPFAGGRWRLVYRLNEGEDREEMSRPERATALLHALLPDARVRRFLWASTFRLAQRQSHTYRVGRWVLAGDAAHAMGPSAGAGLQVGALGAWRLGWRLALAVSGHPLGPTLLDDYDREQHAGSAQVQRENELIFRNLALRSRALGALRQWLLGLASHVPALANHLAAVAALEAQVLPVEAAADAPRGGPWRELQRLGPWRRGARMPGVALSAHPRSTSPEGRHHLLVPLGRADPQREAALLQAVAERLPVPGTPLAAGPEAPWRVPHGPVAVAVVRPDQQVVTLCAAPS